MAKSDPDELEARYEFTGFLLSRRLYKSDIKRNLMRKYSVSSRTCETYLAEAKRRMVDRSGRSRDEHRMDSLAFYESIVSGPESDIRDKMNAQTRIDWLLGLEAPSKFEHDINCESDMMVTIVEQVIGLKNVPRDKNPPDACGTKGLPE